MGGGRKGKPRDDKRHKDRHNPRNAPIERFIWQEGDIVITHDPYAEKYSKDKHKSIRKEERED